MIALMLALVLQEEIVKESDHELAAGAAVSVRTVTGRVRLRGTDKGVAHVRTAKRGRDRELVEIKVEASKDKLTIETKYPDRARSLEIEIEIDVDVPRTLKSLAAEAVSGTIEVKDSRGDSKFQTVSGSIDVDGLQGDLTAVTISGDVRIARHTGDRASIQTTSGSLKGGAEVRDWAFTSVSGRAEFEISPKGDAWSVKASSISGDLHLQFPAKSGAKVDLKTLSGDLRSDFDLQDARRSDRRDVDRFLRGVFGDGVGTIRANTISGDVKLGRMK